MKFILVFLCLCIALYALAASALYRFQRQLIYFPTPAIPHGFTTEKINVKAGINEGQRNAIVINPGHHHAVLYFGGNAEAVALSAEEFKPFTEDTTIYFVEYSGYGNSTGAPSESQLYLDALAWHERLASKHTHISVIGRSLGSGVATYLAAERPIHKLVLVTPFDSILRVAQNRFSLFPVSFLLKDQFHSDTRAPQITAPTLIMIAKLDSIVPAHHALTLADAFPEQQKTVHIFNTAEHNNISATADYFHKIFDFLKPEGSITTTTTTKRDR